MSNITKRAFFTVKWNLLYQYVFFPILFTLILIAPLGFYTFINMFISVYSRNNLFNIVLLNFVATLTAFLCGRSLAKRVYAFSPKNAGFDRLATLVSPTLNAIAIFIAYIAGGIYAARITSFAVNPLFIIVNLLFNGILENSAIMIMFLSSVAYTAAFLIFTRKAFTGFYPPDKKQGRIFALIVSIVTSLALASCTFAVYPEVEYEILKAKYESLPFTEEVDYNFYSNLPFDEYSNLVKTDEKPSLDFTDVMTTPRLDGATAFYPVYAAVAENCYSGLKSGMENNDWRFAAEGYDGDNIMLYNPYERPGDSLFARCAELISCTQTTRAYNNLADGLSDVVFAFEPSDEQIAYAAQRGVEFKLTPIGYDAFCFFVNEKNPIDNLSLKQIQDIYSGKITNWRKAGGKNKRIFAFTRPPNSGSQTIMENLVMKDIPISTKFEAQTVSTMGWIIKVVDGYLNTPAAIGYTFMYYSSFMVKGESIKYLAIDGVAPSNENVRTGTYIFSAPFYAVTVKGRETPHTQKLLDWLKGNEGQDLIEKCGYVGV